MTKERPRDWYSVFWTAEFRISDRLSIIRNFSQFLEANVGRVPRLGQYRFLP